MALGLMRGGAGGDAALQSESADGVSQVSQVSRGGGGGGAPGRSRTSDLLVRSQLLYPAELRAHIAGMQPSKNS